MGGTPSPSAQSLGIIVLGENRKTDYRAQSLAGKILMSKNLEGEIAGIVPERDNAAPRTVASSPIIAQLKTSVKVGCHTVGCGKG
jgi:hypothetical protein